jgi:hypothetical protein
MRRAVVILAGAILLLVGLAIPAAADVPKNCWGIVTMQRATTEGDIGEHSSSFAGDPRLGLGNVADLFGFTHVSELGSFLATVDQIEATSCG